MDDLEPNCELAGDPLQQLGESWVNLLQFGDRAVRKLTQGPSQASSDSSGNSWSVSSGAEEGRAQEGEH